MKIILGWVLILLCPFLFITETIFLAVHGSMMAIIFLSILVFLGCTVGGLYLLAIGDNK